MAKEMMDAPAANPMVGLSAEQLMAILATVGQTNADAMKRSISPQNDTAPPNSPYHPLGMTKNVLSRETFFCYVKQREDTLTPGEVDAFNSIDRDCEARNGSWKARIERNGTTERLFVEVPSKSVDSRMDLPNPRPTSPKTGLEMIIDELLGRA